MDSSFILENLPAPIIVADLLAAQVLFANSSFCNLIDLSNKDIVGQNVSTLDSFIITGDGSSIFTRMLDFSDQQTEKVEIRTGNLLCTMMCNCRIMIQDQSIFALVIFENIHHPDGNIIATNSLILTEQETHALRSNLNTILSLSHFTHDENIAEKIGSISTEIHNAGADILNIIHSKTLHMEEHSTEEPENDKIDIIKVIKMIIQSYLQEIRTKKIHLHFTTSMKTLLLNIDEAVFREAFTIYIKYAIQGTINGEIRLEIFEKYSEKSRLAVIRLTDSGPGIKKSYMDLLKAPPSKEIRASVSGTDRIYIDFSKAKLLMQQIGGDVVLESMYGVGTTVSINLPYPQVTEPPAKGKDIPDDPGRTAEITEEVQNIPEVLLVDDDQIVFHIIKRFLANRCNIDYAVDGRRALLAASSKHYDIIFLDINLGVGLTGLQIAKRLRQQQEYSKTPIIAITAYAMPGDKERAIAAGCTYYQSKPFSRADILRLYSKALVDIASE